MSDDTTIRPFCVAIPRASLDDPELYPARFVGSACGRAMSGKPSSTLGFERRINPALRHRSRDDFVAFMLADLPAPPNERRALPSPRLRPPNSPSLTADEVSQCRDRS